MNSITHEDLMLLACGELDDQRAAEVRGEVERDPALATELAEMERVMQAIAVETQPASPGFEQVLMARLRNELGARRTAPGASAFLRLRRLLGPVGAIAAILALALLLWPEGPKNSSVAWADVVGAIARISQFHVTAFADEPRNSDRAKMYRIDLYYKAPDSWRAHGFDQVQIISAGKTTVYDAASSRFLDPAATRVRLIPPDFAKQVEKHDLMAAILSEMFQGKIPAGEPVKSDAVVAQEGIEVFDYAVNASQMWAHIWVMKQSRLPIRINVYSPGSDDFMLVTFDYTDPQPDSFFDPAKFEKSIRSMSGPTTRQAFNSGMAIVSGTKPVNSAQIHDVNGAYQAPRILSAEGNDAGDVRLVTDVPVNVPPGGGHPIQEGYQKITDNWGNRYVLITWSEDPQGDPASRKRWYFTPVPPFHRGEGKRVLSLSYELTEHSPETWTVVAQQNLEIPDTVNGLPAQWGADGATEFTRRFVIMQYIRRFEPLARQLAAIDEWQKAEPKSLMPILWKVDVMRRHGRRDAAQKLFETQALNRLMADPLCAGFEGSRMLGDELFRQWRHGKTAQVQSEISQLKSFWERAKTNPRQKSDGQYAFEDENSPLRLAMSIPDLAARFQAGEKPKLNKIVASKDGFVLCEMSYPAIPSWASEQAQARHSGEQNFLNFWSGGAQLKDISAAAVDPKSRTRWVIGRPSDPSKVVARGKVALAWNSFSGEGIDSEWTSELPVPAATVDDAAGLFAQLPPGLVWEHFHAAPKTIAEQLQNSRNGATDAGRWLDAAEANHKLIDLPAADWPAYYTDPRNGGLLDHARLQARLAWALDLAKAGKSGEADAAIAPLVAALSAKQSFDDPQDIETRQLIRSVELEQVRQMIARGDQAGAGAKLAEIEKSRPNPADLPDGMVRAKRLGSTEIFWPRTRVADAWNEFDTVKWDYNERFTPH